MLTGGAGGVMVMTLVLNPVLPAKAQTSRPRSEQAVTTTMKLASGTGVVVDGRDASTSFCEVTTGVTSIATPPNMVSCKAGTPTNPYVVTNNDGEGTIPCFSYTTNLPWCAKLAGARWESLNSGADDSSDPPPAFYLYSTNFTLCQTASATLSGSMLADGAAGVFLNGTLLTSMPDTGTSANFVTPTSFGSSTEFAVGTNTITFIVHDTTAPYTGLDYSATVTSPACETLSCSRVKGVATFVPPLVNGGTVSDEAKISLTLSDCIGSDNPIPRSGKATSSGPLTTNSCSNLKSSGASSNVDGSDVVPRTAGPIQGLDVTIGKKIKHTSTASDVLFGGYSNIGDNSNFGWSLGGVGTSVTGFYQGSDGGSGSTAQYVTNGTDSQITAACEGAGLKSLKIVSGSISLK
jgi:hypothetical protein